MVVPFLYCSVFARLTLKRPAGNVEDMTLRTMRYGKTDDVVEGSAILGVIGVSRDGFSLWKRLFSAVLTVLVITMWITSPGAVAYAAGDDSSSSDQGRANVLPGHNRSLQRARLQSDESHGRHIQHLRQHRRVGQAVIHAAFRGGRGPRPMGAGGVGCHQPQTEHRAAGRGPQRRQARGRRLRQLGIVAVQQDHVGPAAEKRLRAGQRQEPRPGPARRSP